MAALAVAAIAGGTALKIMGQRRADEAQAEAERRNAEFFFEQEKFASFAAEREEDIFQEESDDFLSSQRTAFAKAGVSMSGSPLLALLDSKENIRTELNAIRKEGALRVRLAGLRASASLRKAKDIEDSKDLRSIGTLLTGGGQAFGAAK